MGIIREEEKIGSKGIEKYRKNKEVRNKTSG